MRRQRGEGGIGRGKGGIRLLDLQPDLREALLERVACGGVRFGHSAVELRLELEQQPLLRGQRLARDTELLGARLQLLPGRRVRLHLHDSGSSIPRAACCCGAGRQLLRGSSRLRTCSPAPPSAAYAGATPSMNVNSSASDGSTPWEKMVTAAAAVIARCSAVAISACLFGLTMLMAMRGRTVPRSCSDGRARASDRHADSSHRRAGSKRIGPLGRLQFA